ncbi:MAG: hypothetical protein VZS44_11505 [Bacilli bacterium]|nr:hypothetical protein [Bacilli bacterium]
MRKASFTVSMWQNYNGVPIPDHLTESSEIIDYLKENIEDFDKYRDKDFELAAEPLYQAILEDDDGNETTITLDD